MIRRVPEPLAGIPRAETRCADCGAKREVIWRKCLPGVCIELRSYLRTDGVRFTGFAPECNG